MVKRMLSDFEAAEDALALSIKDLEKAKTGSSSIMPRNEESTEFWRVPVLEKRWRSRAEVPDSWRTSCSSISWYIHHPEIRRLRMTLRSAAGPILHDLETL